MHPFASLPLSFQHFLQIARLWSLLYSAVSQGLHKNSLLALPTAIIQRGQTLGIVVLFPDVICSIWMIWSLKKGICS